MKSNITLISGSRELFGVTIRQETKTGFLNLSDLDKAYERARKEFGWPERRMRDILSLESNAERAYYILHKQGFIKASFLAFMENVKKEGLINALKASGGYVTKGRGDNKATWCNPYIWTLVAMEMNPLLYAEVVTWLTDKLILNRIDAGNLYVGLSKAVARFPGVDYSAMAKALNYIVFGRHDSGIRNTGTEAQLEELHKLELNLEFSIASGFIKDFEGLMNHLRVLWAKKHDPIKKLA